MIPDRTYVSLGAGAGGEQRRAVEFGRYRLGLLLVRRLGSPVAGIVLIMVVMGMRRGNLGI